MFVVRVSFLSLRYLRCLRVVDVFVSTDLHLGGIDFSFAVGVWCLGSLQPLPKSVFWFGFFKLAMCKNRPRKPTLTSL